jgi:hypothetical protein
LNWLPVEANQIKTHKYDPIYQEHNIRFAPVNSFPISKVGDVGPEIYVRNSHNRVCSYRAALAIKREVCSNDLIVVDKSFAKFSQFHIDTSFEIIQEMLYEATNRFSELAEAMVNYGKITLSPSEKTAFAQKAIDYHWGEDSVINPNELLASRREADKKDDLFTVFNVIQENMIKGGVQFITPNDSIRHTRPILGVSTDFKVNTFLWSLMVNFSINRKF